MYQMPGYSGKTKFRDTYTILIGNDAEKIVKKKVKINVIDGGRRTLVPGFIDNHVHLALNDDPYNKSKHIR